MRQFQNVLIVRTDRIGDVVLTTPAIEAVRANLQNAKISVLVSRNTQELVSDNPYIDEVIVEDRKNNHRGWMGFWKLVGEIKRRRFDCAIIFHTKRRTNLLCFLAGIPFRIGYQDKNYGFLLTQPVKDDRSLGIKHEVFYCLDLLKHLGFKTDGYSPKLFVDPKAEHFVDDWIKKNQWSNRKIIVIHPGASDLTKCWPVQSFARLIEQLTRNTDCVIVVFGADNIKDILNEIRQSCNVDFFDLVGKTSLSQIMALLKRSHLLISNDSGPVHVGAALGIYVIALFLRNQPGINAERWKPFGAKGFILSNKPEDAVILNRSGQKVASGLKDSITVDEVLHLALDLIARR